MNNNSNGLIVGFGSALVDILINEDDNFLELVNAAKGGMLLVDLSVLSEALSNTSAIPTIVPGGSACNTIIGVARLGGPARFVGKRGSSKMGELFESDLKKNRVEPMLLQSTTPTGRVLSIITPDAQRSMLTYLGASAEAKPDEINDSCFKDAAIVHIEGYLLFNEALITAVLIGAKNNGALVSIDLASYTVVEATKSVLENLIKKYVDIIIANEDEAMAFTGHSNENDAIKALSEKADYAVLKVGKRGSYIAHNNDVLRIDPIGSGPAVDTTGAGDLWASGFLYGLANKFPLELCGKLGSACGYEVCQVIGANIPDQGWNRIKEILP
ncbi:MAG: adenosine kinase [candidate division Zixibacteria bacterium]|nr:adenosine kinase [candidate division Zixibacteria bacterium]